jgi:hypothetical protein
MVAPLPRKPKEVKAGSICPMGGWQLFLLIVSIVGMQACDRPTPSPAKPRASANTSGNERVGELPEVAGFIAGPPTRDAAAVRRTYTRGAARIVVTRARFPLSPEQYDDWVKTSTAGYPQATLDVRPGTANGFYQCTAGIDSSCDLLIQLRAGVHLELRGSGTSHQRDVDDLARGLPLRTIASP